MEWASSLASNSAFALLADLANKSVNGVLFWVISRLYGPTEAGVFALAVSFLYVSSRLSFLGLEQILTRDVARDPEQVGRYFYHFAVLRLLVSGAAWLLLWLLLLVAFDYTPHTRNVILTLGLAVFPENAIYLCQAVFAAFEQMRYQAIAGLLGGVVKLAGGIGAAIALGSLEKMAMVLVVANLVAALVHLYLVSSVFLAGHAFRFRMSFCIEQLRGVVPFLFISVVSILDTQLGPIVLSLFSPESEVGIYGAALTVVNVLNLMPQAYRVSVFPVLSRVFARSTEQVAPVYTRSLRYMFLLSLPLAVGGMVLSTEVIDFLYSPEFAAASSVLPILLLSWLLSSINVVNTRLLIAAHRQAWCAVNLAVGLTANLGGSVLYVPRFGIIAAAGARLVASAGILVGTFGGVTRFIGPVVGLGTWVKPVLAAALMAGVARLVATLTDLHVVLVAAIGALVYVSFLLFTGALDAEDRQALAALCRRLRGHHRPTGRA